MKTIRPLLFFLFSILIISSCQKNDNVAPIDYSVFPVNIGHTIIYDVDSVIYDPFKGGARSETHSQLRDVIVDSYLDNENRPTQRVERYVRKQATDSWTFVQVYAMNLTTTNAQTLIDNQRVINLSFPAYLNASWNGNAQNTDESKRFRYNRVDESFSNGTTSYPGTITVLQRNERTLINKFYFQEKYAPGVGLVYKQCISDSANDITQEPLENRISGGLEVTFTINSYTK